MDHDQLFKDLLTTFFAEFLELYDPARSGLISQFMDSYLKLTAAEKIVYDTAAEVLSTSEKEISMQFTNEWTELGAERGRKEGRLEVVARLLRKRFGILPTEVSSRLNGLSGEQLSELAEALLDFKTITDAHVWLSNLTV